MHVDNLHEAKHGAELSKTLSTPCFSLPLGLPDFDMVRESAAEGTCTTI